ncbi:tryptophan--tRNA ligase [Candidatus Saccharibacteria bacterium 32-49-12]|nr:MAG: tryptophan--tRNA ligase [Candidatus Saccharibacteria bacterium 32-49-12]
MRDVILTGIRSNEEPTIANYLGSFLPMVELQSHYGDEYQINMFVPDLHSFTTPINHQQLYQNTLHNLKYFVAAGLDIKHPSTYIYRQSYISAHSELTWILDCFTYMGEMQRMIQFKDKSNESSETVTVGLFNYPVLMAADILLYSAKWVPVGEDQFQHLEITRDIATRFNNKFGDIFTIPEPTQSQTRFIKRDQGLRIRSLTDPTKKMSKSSNDDKSKINLSDTAEQARKKIMSATTDSVGVVNFDWATQPGVTNLLQMISLLSHQTQDEVNKAWVGSTQYGELKSAAADVVCDFLNSLHQKYQSVSDEYILSHLEISEEAMRQVAEQKLRQVQVAVGLRPRG